MTVIGTVLAITLVATLSPLIAGLLRRFLPIPLIVLEIVLGIVVGPGVLNMAGDTALVKQLSSFGLAMLFFMAGTEINFRQVRGRPLRRSALGWLIAVVVGVGAGILLAQDVDSGFYLGIALSSTAFGTLLPILIDGKVLGSPFGIAVMAIGAMGEFGPLAAISIFLGSRAPERSTFILIGFVVVATGAIVLAARGRHKHLHRLINATLHTTGQFAVRLVIVIVAALVALSVWLGLDMLLGAFAAGVLVQYLLASANPADAREVRGKLDAVAFGVFVPIFFVGTGITYNVSTLVHERFWWLLVPGFLVLMVVIRGLSGLVSAPAGSSAADRRALVLLTATGLPIIVAVAEIGVERGELPEGAAVIMIGAGLLSVLLFPLLGMAQHARRKVGKAAGG